MDKTKLTEYNGMRVGDVITTYHVGYWTLTGIEPRKKEAPVFHYKLSYKISGEKATGKRTGSCDASYCKPAHTRVTEEIKRMETELENLRNLMSVIDVSDSH